MKQQPGKTKKQAYLKTGILLGAWLLHPSTGYAGLNTPAANLLPIQMSLTAYFFIGFLLLLSIIMFFIFQRRFNAAHRELKDVTGELAHTRERLTETSKTLEKTELDLKNTATRYQGILFEAQVGMFQMDVSGKCTYINSAMQELSGLYPKKALKEGLPSAIHPDDRELFNQGWKSFTEENKPFELRCRFRHAKGRVVHVTMRANKVFNERKDVESYIGWVSDVTLQHEEQLRQQAATARYSRFVEETVEGYYQLAPENPIPLNASTPKMAETIMSQMRLVSCNETFAAMYGASPDALKGKAINAMQDGCGPFRNNESIKEFVASKYSMVDIESVRQDPRGNRLSLLNHVVGLVEDNKLVGIWGSQRNISQQKREKEELTSQAQFMRRILNALPADVHVKDTRCRYLYASKKLSDRTGIPQEEWIGKTIFEIMPATPRDHDRNAVDVMKTAKLSRCEQPYEARGKSGWMETIQIPLVSKDGLVEGVVGLSFEISERKKQEAARVRHHQSLEQQLKNRNTELQKTQGELGQAAITLRDTNQKLRIREAELENREHEFRDQLNERKRAEDLLRRNEQNLLTRQKQLEENLSKRLNELKSETDKRRKWEELIAIKEEELGKVEEISSTRGQQLKKEIALRERHEANLKTLQVELGQTRRELETLNENHRRHVASLTEQQKNELGAEQSEHKKAARQLKITEDLLQQTQDRMKTLTEQQAAELEHEVAERKTATSKLIESTEELEELKQQFSIRIEEETKLLKKELAQKQIREKTLRQHEKDLDGRIKELEKTLQLKIREHGEQIQAREGVEVERKQMEQKLDQMTKRQKALVERETQKLNLSIAEIRLDEVKLRQEVVDLQQAKEDLEGKVKHRTAELNTAIKQQQATSTTLAKTQAQLQILEKDQAALVARETHALQEELKQLKHTEQALRQQEELLQKQSEELEATIRTLNEKIKHETGQREKVEKDFNELQLAFDASQDNVSALIEEQTHELQEQIELHLRTEDDLKKTAAGQDKKLRDLQQAIDERSRELDEARKEREKAELDLVQAIERSGQDAQEIEKQIASIKSEHAAEIQRIKDEEKELRQNEKHYRSIFQSSADAYLELNPKSGQIEMANLASAHLFGEETSGALTGRTLQAMSPDEQPDQIPSPDKAKARLLTAIETGQDVFEWTFEKADGASFHTLVSLSIIDVEEKQLVLAMVKDISVLKQRENELQQTLSEALAANEINSKVVEEVNEAVQTSLHPVVTSSGRIEKAENLTVEQKLDVAVINRNCRTLIDMMSYRNELCRIDEGLDELDSDKCDLHELIKDLDEQFCHRAETKKLFFAVSFAQYQSANNVPKLVETDGIRVRKILTILLGYALAHTDKGRLGLHASRKSCEGDQITISFELAYTGAQKEDPLLGRVFGDDDGGDPNATDMKYGLTLARRNARMLGGEIALDYRKSDVTALTIDLTFRKVDSEIVMPKQNDENAVGAA
jgi:PAS domain S-box-containing protein